MCEAHTALGDSVGGRCRASLPSCSGRRSSSFRLDVRQDEVSKRQYRADVMRAQRDVPRILRVRRRLRNQDCRYVIRQNRDRILNLELQLTEQEHRPDRELQTLNHCDILTLGGVQCQTLLTARE